jgi:hypothetical protein
MEMLFRNYAASEKMRGALQVASPFFRSPYLPHFLTRDSPVSRDAYSPWTTFKGESAAPYADAAYYTTFRNQLER